MKKTSYHKRIVQFLLSDRQWHSFKEIHKAVARFVDGEAADVEFRRRHKDWKQIKAAERIAHGRRRLVFLSLNSMHHHRKMVEVGKGRADERMYRLTRAALKSRNGQAEKPTSTKAPATKKATVKSKARKERKPAPSKKPNGKAKKATTTAKARPATSAKPKVRKESKPAVAEPKPTTTSEPTLFSTSEA